MAENNSGRGFFSGAFWGVIIGAIGGLLLAPKKGEETRKELKEKIDVINEKVSETIKTVDTNTKELQNNIKNTGIDLAKKAAVKIEEVSKIVNDQVKPKLDLSSSSKMASTSIDIEQKKKRFFKGI